MIIIKRLYSIDIEVKNMANKETVIKGLEICTSIRKDCSQCPYLNEHRPAAGCWKLMRDALELITHLIEAKIV